MLVWWYQSPHLTLGKKAKRVFLPKCQTIPLKAHLICSIRTMWVCSDPFEFNSVGKEQATPHPSSDFDTQIVKKRTTEVWDYILMWNRKLCFHVVAHSKRLNAGFQALLMQGISADWCSIRDGGKPQNVCFCNVRKPMLHMVVAVYCCFILAECGVLLSLFQLLRTGAKQAVNYTE